MCINSVSALIVSYVKDGVLNPPWCLAWSKYAIGPQVVWLIRNTLWVTWDERQFLSSLMVNLGRYRSQKLPWKVPAAVALGALSR